MAFRVVSGGGPWVVHDSAGTIAAGDAVQYNESGEVVVAATAKAVVGVAVAAATSSTTCTIEIVYPSTLIEADISTGSFVAAEIGQEADLEDENSLTLTESNNDFIITGGVVGVTNKCLGHFVKCDRGSMTVAA